MNRKATAFTGLSKLVKDHLTHYFQAHEGQLPAPGLYKRVLQEVEKPLIVSILEAVEGSQVKAAKVLGISRNTLRKKLEELDIETNVS